MECSPGGFAISGFLLVIFLVEYRDELVRFDVWLVSTGS